MPDTGRQFPDGRASGLVALAKRWNKALKHRADEVEAARKLPQDLADELARGGAVRGRRAEAHSIII